MKRVFALAAMLGLFAAAGVRAEDKPGEKPGRPGAGKPGAGRPGAGKPGEGGPGMLMARLFEKGDADGDGKISKDEFKKAMENAPGGRLKENPEMADKMFQRMDANGDGFITKDEMKKAQEQFQNRPGAGKPGAGRPGAKPPEKKPDDK